MMVLSHMPDSEDMSRNVAIHMLGHYRELREMDAADLPNDFLDKQIEDVETWLRMTDPLRN